MSIICAYAQFTASKIGVDGLVVTWDIEQITRSSGARSALVTGGANSIAIGRRGLYGYVLAGADLTLYDYVFTAITATTTVDAREVPALWTLWSLSWHDILTAALSLANTVGKLLVDNINATIGSRSSHSPGDVDTQLTGTHGAGSWSGLGTGAVAQLVHIEDPLGNPVDNVDVWITTDVAGVNIIARGYTDAFGDITFMLDPGSYYCWKDASGYNETNPQVLVVP
jgi:hypothetical protein